MATITNELRTIFSLVGARDFIKQVKESAKSIDELAEAERKRKANQDDSSRAFQKTLRDFIVGGAIINEARLAFAEFLDTESRLIRFQQVLLNLGRTADIPIFKNLADDVSRLTGVDDDLVLSLTQTLAQFNLTRQAIQQLTPAIVNLADAQGISLEQASKAVTATLLGERRALAVLGIEFRATGNRQEDAIRLTRILNAETREMAAIFRNSLPGAVRAFHTELGNLRADVIRELEPSLRAVTERLITFLRFLRTNASEVADLLRILFNPFQLTPLGAGGARGDRTLGRARGGGTAAAGGGGRSQLESDTARGANAAEETARNTRQLPDKIARLVLGGGPGVAGSLNIRGLNAALRSFR